MVRRLLLERLRGIGSISNEELERTLSELENKNGSGMPSGVTGLDFLDSPKDVAGFQRYLEEGEEFFYELSRLFRGDDPEVLIRLKRRFSENKHIAQAFVQISPDSRKICNLDQLPHFWLDFNSSAKGLLHGYRDGCDDVRIDDLVITDNILGKGGFSFVYKANGRGGEEYAVKLFRPRSSFPFSERFSTFLSWKVRDDILRGLSARKNIFSSWPFIPVRTICKSGGYVMDYFKGNNVGGILHSEEIGGLPFELKHERDNVHSLLLAYSSMLSRVHHEGLVYNDNSWSNVLLGWEDGGARVCDYDLVSTLKECEDRKAKCYWGHNQVSPREKSLPSRDKPICQSSDLESFALMIDRLFNDDYLICREGVSSDLARLEASNNRRIYDPERASKIPQKLRPAVIPLIQYPRDDLITADDLVSAIKDEYKV